MRKIIALLVLLAHFGANAQAPARIITLDVAKEKGPLNKPFDLCVGAGRANEGLRADWQQQLALARPECGFRYLRCV